MKKRIITLTLLILCTALLAGCQCEHEWVEADCVTAKTCSKCQETEGEPLGHDWQEASCAAPKTCALCGETEGEALPHTWVEANYQDPMTCSVCGATEGEPWTADFEKYGLADQIMNKSGFRYSYITACYENPDHKTTGNLYFRNYRIFESDEAHSAVDGYEWRAFDLEIQFADSNAWLYGVSVNPCFENYYAIEEWDNSSFNIESTKWGYLSDTARGYIVNYHGLEYPVVISFENEDFSEWENKSCSYTANYYVCVPIGYDGFVAGFHDASTTWEDGMYIYDVADENTLFFRLDNQDAITESSSTSFENDPRFACIRDTSTEHIPVLNQRLLGSWKSGLFYMVDDVMQAEIPDYSIEFGENKTVSWITDTETHSGTWAFSACNTPASEESEITATYSFVIHLDDSTSIECSLFLDEDTLSCVLPDSSFLNFEKVS